MAATLGFLSPPAGAHDDSPLRVFSVLWPHSRSLSRLLSTAIIETKGGGGGRDGRKGEREVGRASMDPMCENKQPATTLCPGVQHAIPSLSLSLLLSLSARLLTENRNGTGNAASGFDNLELHAVVVVVQFLLISCSRASPAELEIFCSPLSSFASSLASCVALAAEHRQN